MAARERNEDRLESRRDARPVKGRIIRGKYFGPLRYAGLGAFLIVVALLLLAYINNQSDADDPRVDFLRVRPYIAFFYGALIVIGSLLVFSILMVRNRRMILGKDRLQLIGGFGKVLGQLPYDNILETEMTPHMGVEIILDRLNRRDTWWPGLDTNERGTVIIGAGMEADGTAIRLYLRNILREFREQRGGRPREFS